MRYTGVSSSAGSAGAADTEISILWKNMFFDVRLAANATFDDLTREICNNWDELLQVDFTINVNKKTIRSDADVPLLLHSSDRVLKVKSYTVCFDQIELKAVKEWAGIGGVEEYYDHFDSAFIDESILSVKAIIDHAVADLKYKDALYGPITGCVEDSVREYISTILTAAAGIATEIDLIADREINGRRATGSLDYAMLYKHFYIPITEAKRDNLNTGVVQNIAQIIASRETYLFKNQNRKRKYMDIADQAQVPSTGIVSAGKEWMLLRYFLHPEPVVLHSAVYLIPISEICTAETDSELRRHVVVVIGKIVEALNLMKEEIDTNDFTKKQKF